jgi:hypothetical protein
MSTPGFSAAASFGPTIGVYRWRRTLGDAGVAAPPVHHLASIRAALPIGLGARGKCTCIAHGDSTLFDCCKVGTNDCRACVGETTEKCCDNLYAGKPSPLPIPKQVVIF